MTLTIPRENWRCARGQSHLVNADGTSCILGHLLLALGYTSEQLRKFNNVASFADESGLRDEALSHPILSQLVELVGVKFQYLNRTDLEKRIVEANDQETQEKAEKLLPPLLAGIGVEVRFV